MEKVNIFGINYAVTDYAQASSLILEKALSKQAFSVFALPVHGVIEFRKEDEFKSATLAADLVVPDGQPIRWAMNYFYDTALDDRVYGPKLMQEVFSRANEHRLRIFLYGGSTSKVLDDFESYILSHYSKLQIVGKYREDTFGEEKINLDIVADARPDIVLVGLGCPVQEKWIARNQSKMKCVLMGVGAAFSFYSGATKMAPEWMQNRGLEWLYRLYKEPRRLWKRYFYYNSYFILLVAKKYFKLGS